MSGAAYQTRRPTEDAAVNAASRGARPVPTFRALFDCLRVAHATGDRCGVRLCQHAIARTVREEAVS